MTKETMETIEAELHNCQFNETDLVESVDFGRKIHNDAIDYALQALKRRFTD